MKIQAILSTNINSNKQPKFRGLAQYAPSRRIFDANDAIAQWKVMKHPKFSEIFQEEDLGITNFLLQQNKKIRNSNYSFLEQLKDERQMAKFIEHFKNVTGFPSLTTVSKKIREEFSRVLKLANESTFQYREKPADWYHLTQAERELYTNQTILSGYDKFCSVGLNAALPGSDLDNAFAIIKGINGNYEAQANFTKEFSGKIWENIDNRIMSVNHIAAFPNIRTDKQLADDLEVMDTYAGKFVNNENINYFRYIRMSNGNPISGSKFNIYLSQEIPHTPLKYEAKNLAYLIEGIRDGKWIDFKDYLYENLYRTMEGSYFGHCSNVTQAYVMQNKYDYDDPSIIKNKIKARKEMEKLFDYLPIKEQYEIVKDIIRSMSGDNENPDYKNLFDSPEDRHRLLLNDILRGKVDCCFESFPNGNEKTHLFFKDSETAQKYYDLNIYKTNH